MPMDSPESTRRVPADLRDEPPLPNSPDTQTERIPPPPSYAAATYDVESDEESAASVYAKLKMLKTLRERRK